MGQTTCIAWALGLVASGTLFAAGADAEHAAVFLASDESSFVNGHDFVVDGGLTGGLRWSEQQARLQGMRAAFLAQSKPGN